MTAHIPQYKLSYISVPKNACSSIKRMLFRLENGRNLGTFVANGQVQTIHHIYPTPRLEGWQARRPRDHWTFAVLRDPVARFVSAYINKIHQDRVLEGITLSSEDVDRGISVTPSLSAFIRDLPHYRRLSVDLRRHTDPQVVYLGPDAALFDRLYQFQDLPVMVEELNARTGQPLHLTRSNTSDAYRPDVPALSVAEREKLRDFYHKDYEVYGAALAPDT